MNTRKCISFKRGQHQTGAGGVISIKQRMVHRLAYMAPISRSTAQASTPSARLLNLFEHLRVKQLGECLNILRSHHSFPRLHMLAEAYITLPVIVRPSRVTIRGRSHSQLLRYHVAVRFLRPRRESYQEADYPPHLSSPAGMSSSHF